MKIVILASMMATILGVLTSCKHEKGRVPVAFTGPTPVRVTKIDSANNTGSRYVGQVGSAKKNGDLILDLRDSVYSEGIHLYGGNNLEYMRRGYNSPALPPYKKVSEVKRTEWSNQFQGTIYDHSNHVKIQKRSLISRVAFHCPANFSEINFNDNVSFNNVDFLQKPRFEMTNFKSGCYFEHVKSSEGLLFDRTIFNNVIFSDFSLDSNTVFFFDVKYKKMSLEQFTLDSLVIHTGYESKSNSLKLKNLKANYIEVREANDTLILENIVINQPFVIPSPVYLSDSAENNARPHPLYVRGVDLSKLILDYRHYKLMAISPDGQPLPDNEMTLLYEGLLKNFKVNGSLESYQLLDIEFRSYQDNSLWKWKSRLNRWWWNFGYEPELVFTHILWFLLIFIVITFFTLEPLQEHVYSLEAFLPPSDSSVLNVHRDMYAWHSPALALRKLWYSTAYAIVVFLLLSIKIEYLKFSPKLHLVLLTVFVIFMHITGLICLGYVAHFVLQQ